MGGAINLFKNRTPLEVMLIIIVLINTAVVMFVFTNIFVCIVKDGVYHKIIHIEVSK